MTVKIDGDHRVLTQPCEHNHDSTAHQKTVHAANNALKELAEGSSSLKPSQIIRDVTVQADSNCRVYLPSKKAQNTKIARVRSKKHGICNEPNDIDSICIPENLRYLEGELFVLSEKRFDGALNIMLGTKSSLKSLERAQCWVMDGTFYVCPSIFRQLFTIHGVIEGQVLPLIFCLMSEKSKKAYAEVFYELCKVAVEESINLNPQRFITDFELAISSAAKTYFPSANFRGCLFHFGQNIWRRVQKEGLTRKYGNIEDFSILIRMLKSLAFVPPEQMPDYYNELKGSNNDKDLKKNM